MTHSYGSKSVVVGAHYGVGEWLVQRATDVLRYLFTLRLVALPP